MSNQETGAALEAVRSQLREARRLAYRADRMLDAPGFGRCSRIVVELEAQEDALLGRNAGGAR